MPFLTIGLGQAFQQCLGVHEIRHRETFRVTPINRRERAAGLLTAALTLPKPGEARRGVLPPSIVGRSTVRH